MTEINGSDIFIFINGRIETECQFCESLFLAHKITMKRCLKPVFINVHLQKCVGANPLKNSHPHLFSNNWQLAEAVLTSFSINILKM